MDEDQIIYEPIDAFRQDDTDFGQWPQNRIGGPVSGEMMPTIEW
ncbi:hypothetical protein [Oricola indica]